MTPLVIIGAGGFGREVHDIVVALNRCWPRWEFLGFIDDTEPDKTLMGRRGGTWLGGTERLPNYAGMHYVVGVGDPVVRRSLVQKAERCGLEPVTLVHPSATFGVDVELQAGSVICAHVSVTTNVRIGRHVHVDRNGTVGHDAVLQDFSRLNPGATISGNVTVHEGAVVGSNATIIQGVAVGSNSLVGAGAVVLHDVPAEVRVAGVPAKFLRS